MWSEGFIVWISIVAGDRPETGAGDVAAAHMADRVSLGLELAEAASDLIRRVFGGDVLGDLVGHHFREEQRG